MKVAFYTLGCKVNQYETNAMEQKFINCGYEVVDFIDFANIYIINTCTVTNMADRKSRQMLRKVKEINPEAIICACGCYAQVAREELEKMSEIDLILGINEKNTIVEHIGKFLKERKKETEISDVMGQKEFLDFGATTYTEKTRAVIKVQDGCDRFCSYCIIPYARGRVRSRKIQNIVEEVTMISKKGIKEVVITGIHIASYGKDFKETVSLIDLLEKLNEIEGIERIRLGSLEPTLITEDFIKRLTKLYKVCDHFHLSLQSGCDETLKRMNRKYTTEKFRESVNLLRTVYPEVALTTDVIVGFPGETEEEFEMTHQFLEDINFYKMHIFQYSPRKGTKAAIMPNQVEASKKEERSKKLITLSNTNQLAYDKRQIGRIVYVLLEEQEGEYWKGHTTNYRMVKMKKTEDMGENQMKSIKISRVIEETEEIIGEVV